MSQIRPTLAKALPRDLPPTSWDSRDLEERARTQIRRRRLGGGILAVALLGVALVASLTLFPRTTDVPAGGAKPDFPLPKLDDDRQYGWYFQGQSRTKNTEKIGTAFWDHLREHHPDLDASTASGSAEMEFIRTQRQLWTAKEWRDVYEYGPEADGSEKVYEQPVYTLAPAPGKSGPTFDTGSAEDDERITVEVYPKGGFERGTADVSADPTLLPRPEYLVDGCEGYKAKDEANELRGYKYNCVHPKAVSGQDALVVERSVNGYSNGDITVSVTVVLYRDDGTAVLASMSISAPKAIAPTLTATELLRLAEAIPDVPVT